jgi:hypothetical protein
VTTHGCPAQHKFYEIIVSPAETTVKMHHAESSKKHKRKSELQPPQKTAEGGTNNVLTDTHPQTHAPTDMHQQTRTPTDMNQQTRTSVWLYSPVVVVQNHERRSTPLV